MVDMKSDVHFKPLCISDEAARQINHGHFKKICQLCRPITQDRHLELIWKRNLLMCNCITFLVVPISFVLKVRKHYWAENRW